MIDTHKESASAKLDAKKAALEQPPAPTIPSGPRAQGWFLEHEGLVTIGAIVLLFAGWFAYSSVTEEKDATFARQGLTFAYPAGWFPTDPEPEAFPVDVSFAGLDPTTRLEVRISKKPAFDGPIESVLDLSRSRRYGELYKKLTTTTQTVGSREWLRSDFAYAFKKSEDDSPRVAWAVEYAALNNENLYVVTVHGPEGDVTKLERDVLGTVTLK